MKKILEVGRGVILLIGLCIFVCVWLIVIFFMWIYDAIFGGWNEKK
tara:strand:- start:155 stop:292 length:138 start_codon:yes stop_codon:yes gene_type:complete